MRLEWRTVTSSLSPAAKVRGTVLEQALAPGFLSRFAVQSVRTSRYVASKEAQDGRGYVQLDCTYQIADAHTVSDAETREGISPRVVFKAETLEEIEAWLNSQKTA